MASSKALSAPESVNVWWEQESDANGKIHGPHDGRERLDKATARQKNNLAA